MTKNEIVAREFMREIPGGKKENPQAPQKEAKEEKGETHQGNDNPMTAAQKCIGICFSEVRIAG